MNLWLCALIFVFGSFSWEAAAQKKSCPALTLKNGRVRIRGGGQMAYFRCRKRFKRVGHKLAVCLSSGTWSQQTPVCVGRGCPDLGALPDVTVKEMYRGGILQFTCPEGMRREGPQTLLCDGNDWDKQPPRCLYGASLGCDFEDSGLCGWNQDANDDFDWTWTSGFTPTTKTGPDADHTTGQGHYIFMESSAPQKFGQVTRLISPPYQPPPEPMCLEFFYHMKGPPKDLEVGDLDVLIRTGSGEDAVDRVLFHRDGYQGEDWVRGVLTIPDQSDVFKIVFAATRRQGWSGDIALDDIKVFNCSDMPEETTTTTTITTTTTPPFTTVTTTTAPTTTRTPSTTTTTTTPTTTTTTPTTTTPRPTTTTSTSTTSSAWTTSTTTSPSSSSAATSTTQPTTTTTSATTSTTTTWSSSSSTTMMTPSSSSWGPPSSSSSSMMTSTSTQSTSTPNLSISTSYPSSSSSSSSSMMNTSSKAAMRTTTSGSGQRSTSSNQSSISGSSRTSPGFMGNVSSTTPFMGGGGGGDIHKEGVNETGNSTSLEVTTMGNSSKEEERKGEKDGGGGGGGKGGERREGSTSEDSGSDVTDLLPLIVGVSLGLVVGMVVVGVLAWLWARNKRKQKEIQIEEDQLNIIGSIDGASYSYPPSGSEH